MRSLLLVALLIPAIPACANAPVTPTPPAASTPAPRTVERATFGVRVRGEGPDIVLIPGLTCGGHVWDATVEHLLPGHTVHVLTLSGFAGRAPAAADPFLPAVRDELAAYVRELDRPVIVGHSLGGFMALWMASTEADALAGAIAVDGLPSLGALTGQDPDAIAAFAEQMQRQMAEQSPEAFAKQTAQTLQMQISDPAEAAAVADVSGRSDPGTVGRAMAELLTTDLRPLMSRASVPVLLLGAGGGGDAQIEARREQYRAQVATIPDHEVVMVPGTRHFVMLDAPQVFLEHVGRFVERVQ